MSLNVRGDLGVLQIIAGALRSPGAGAGSGMSGSGWEQEEGAAASVINSFASRSCEAQCCWAELRAGHQLHHCLQCLATRAGSLQSLLKGGFSHPQHCRVKELSTFPQCIL